MVPQWFKNSRIYPSLRRTASALEAGLLRAEYGLLSPSGRQAELLEQVRALPRSNGSGFYAPLPFRVGMVADRFLFENYSCTCQLVYLTPDNWLEQLPGLDCVIVTSVWHGLGGEWTGASLPGSAVSARLCALMEETRRRGCPILFYSKEDPPNFHCFLGYAALADQIYTSAQECVEDYRARCPGIPVDTMHFAISPLLHNPIGMKPLEHGARMAFFAGSWMKKYPTRAAQQKKLFDWVRKAGLHLEIADRNYSRYSLRYRYPLRYLPSVLPDFTYEDVSALYKCYDWVLNLNSVGNSEDMFSLRVYDALACGSLVLSNGSVGMERYFPQVYVIDCYERLLEALETPLSTLEGRRFSGLRQVFRVGTVYERMERMMGSVGLKGTCVNNPLVGVIPGEDVTDPAGLRAMFEAQSYPHKVWIPSVGDQTAVEGCGMVVLWGAGRQYGRHYLEDMVNAFKYTSCDYVTVPDPSQPGGHRYTDHITDRYGTLFRREAYRSLSPGWRGEAAALPNGYCSDGMSYAVDGRPIEEF